MSTSNVYRDGKVHVLSRECDTCIFKPAKRPVSGKRVAEMVRETRNEDGATIVCHSTLYREGPEENAVCRGWYDRMGNDDVVIRLAQVVGAIEEQEPPSHD